MLSRKECEQLCKKFDTDGDGLISVKEFKDFLKVEYVSKRKKRSELETNEFQSQASLVGSVNAGFRGALPVQKKVKVKKPKTKKAKWRSMKQQDETTEMDETPPQSSSSSSPSLRPEDRDMDSPLSLSNQNTNDNEIQSGSEDEWEAGGYDMMGRKLPKKQIRRKRTPIISNTTSELEAALTTIPQEREPEVKVTYSEQQLANGNWFVDSDSEDELVLVNGQEEMTAPRHTAPRMTPIMRNRKNAMEATMIQQYATSWDEPVSPRGQKSFQPSNMLQTTKASGTFQIPTTRAREDKTEWFNETEEGAKHLLDEGDGNIDVTLYRRQWDDRQPGDGSEANPWRVAVKTSWTGEIAAPSWPTKKGTWVYVPNPPKQYELSHHELTLKRTFGRGKEDGADADQEAPDESKDSPRQKRIRQKTKTSKKNGVEHQESTVTYHPMARLNKPHSMGSKQPWNSRAEMQVPDRPPTHNPEWEQNLQDEPIRINGNNTQNGNSKSKNEQLNNRNSNNNRLPQMSNTL